MPTVFTHALAGAAIAQVLARSKHLRAIAVVAAGAAAVPDIDALGMRLGIDYASVFGHRGFTHSLLFAGMVAAGSALLFRRLSSADRWRIAACLFAATASHGLLDALTDGGYGVAFFAPCNDTRYFFPWTPIRVAPLRPASLFSRWGAAVFASEVLWVWVPAGVIAFGARVVRNRRAAS